MRTQEHDLQPEQDVERLSAELREQVQLAKDRISERYGKLMEPRSFERRRRDGD